MGGVCPFLKLVFIFHIFQRHFMAIPASPLKFPIYFRESIY
jgi:hypothetical protein